MTEDEILKIQSTYAVTTGALAAFRAVVPDSYLDDLADTYFSSNKGKSADDIYTDYCKVTNKALFDAFAHVWVSLNHIIDMGYTLAGEQGREPTLSKLFTKASKIADKYEVIIEATVREDHDRLVHNGQSMNESLARKTYNDLVVDYEPMAPEYAQPSQWVNAFSRLCAVMTDRHSRLLDARTAYSQLMLGYFHHGLQNNLPIMLPLNDEQEAKFSPNKKREIAAQIIQHQLLEGNCALSEAYDITNQVNRMLESYFPQHAKRFAFASVLNNQ